VVLAILDFTVAEPAGGLAGDLVLPAGVFVAAAVFATGIDTKSKAAGLQSQ
jgi:hypothetical protein